MSQCRVVDASIPDVYHIKDELGVCVTLLVGADKALLFDTGYGLGGLKKLIKTITDKPVVVVNSHAHWDHALGNRMFGDILMHPADFAMYEGLSAPGARLRILKNAEESGELPRDFDRDAYLSTPMPRAAAFEGGVIALGGLDVDVLRVPGHTSGSLMLHVPARGLLVCGDNWNPTVWMFFEECIPVKQYRANMRKLLDLPFERLLTSHGEHVYPRAVFEQYMANMTDELLAGAPKDVDTPYCHEFDTRRCFPCPDMPLVFDGQRMA